MQTVFGNNSHKNSLFFKGKDLLEVLECFAAYFMKFLKTSLTGICLGYAFHSGKSLLVYSNKRNVLIKK